MTAPEGTAVTTPLNLQGIRTRGRFGREHGEQSVSGLLWMAAAPVQSVMMLDAETSEAALSGLPWAWREGARDDVTTENYREWEELPSADGPPSATATRHGGVIREIGIGLGEQVWTRNGLAAQHHLAAKSQDGLSSTTTRPWPAEE